MTAFTYFSWFCCQAIDNYNKTLYNTHQTVTRETTQCAPSRISPFLNTVRERRDLFIRQPITFLYSRSRVWKLMMTADPFLDSSSRRFQPPAYCTTLLLSSGVS